MNIEEIIGPGTTQERKMTVVVMMPSSEGGATSMNITVSGITKDGARALSSSWVFPVIYLGTCVSATVMDLLADKTREDIEDIEDQDEFVDGDEVMASVMASAMGAYNDGPANPFSSSSYRSAAEAMSAQEMTAGTMKDSLLAAMSEMTDLAEERVSSAIKEAVAMPEVRKRIPTWLGSSIKAGERYRTRDRRYRAALGCACLPPRMPSADFYK